VAAFSGSHRFVLDYLADEVLDRQPGPVRAFLLETSVMERLSAELCDAVTGQAGSQAMLAGIERAGLFLVPLDEVRGWWRYHHLFADLLRARLQAEQPGRVQALHRAAAAWCGEHDLADDAVRHALAAGDAAWAARLVERPVETLLGRSEGATLRRWLSALPAESVRDRPRRGLAQAYGAAMGFQCEAIEALLDDAESALAASGADPYHDPAGRPVSVLANVPAGIAFLRASLARLRGDAGLAAGYNRQALAQPGEDDWLMRSFVRWNRAVTDWLGGRLEPAQGVDVAMQVINDLMRVAFELVERHHQRSVLADIIEHTFDCARIAARGRRQSVREMRRELIEEAAGVRRLRDQRQEALNRLAEAERDMARARDILAELTPRAAELEAQAEAAEEYKRVAVHLKQLQGSLAKDAWRKAMAQLRRARGRLGLAEQKRTSARQALVEFEPGYTQRRSALLEAREARWQHQEAINGVRLQLAESQHQARIAEERLGAARRTLQAAEHEMERLSASAKAGSRVVEELAQSAERTLQEHLELQSQAASAGGEEQAERERLEALQAQSIGLNEDQLELHRQEYAPDGEARQQESRLQFLNETGKLANLELDA